MVEIEKDLWKIPCRWICIPTNGIVKDDGQAVMGAGAALESAQKFWEVPYRLGELLQKHGNKVHLLQTFTRSDYVPRVDTTKFYQMEQVVVSMYSFPTKHHFREKSDLALIEKSCEEIRKLYNVEVWKNKVLPDKKPWIPTVVIPRAGCGCGGLDWETQVKLIFLKHFGDSDDFIICYK